MKVYKRSHPDSTARREKVIVRLENQLKSGKKPLFFENEKGKVVQSLVETTDLTEVDKTRINKELETLRKRV